MKTKQNVFYFLTATVQISRQRPNDDLNRGKLIRRVSVLANWVGEAAACYSHHHHHHLFWKCLFFLWWASLLLNSLILSPFTHRCVLPSQVPDQSRSHDESKFLTSPKSQDSWNLKPTAKSKPWRGLPFSSLKYNFRVVKGNEYCFSVHLARRVLQLERANTSLRKELERENEKSKQLAEEVCSYEYIKFQSFGTFTSTISWKNLLGIHFCGLGFVNFKYPNSCTRTNW